MDQIKIKNLEVFGHHGVFSEETKLGQKFLVNAVLYTDVREAGRRDDLHRSIHYGDVCHYMTKFMQEHTYKLIESAAEHMAEAMLLDIPRLEKLDLEIKKTLGAHRAANRDSFRENQPGMAYSLSVCGF